MDAPAHAIDAERLQALANWLTAGAQPRGSFRGAVEEFGKRLSALGAAVDLLGVYMTTINPNVLGRLTYWTPKAGARHNHVTHAEMATPVWLGTAAEICHRTGRIVRHRIGERPDLDEHPSGRRLAKRGYTDYIALPLIHVHAINSVYAVGTKREGGFADAEVAAFRRLQAPLARISESELLYTNTVSLLSTYVGRNAGELVLRGQILRGDAEVIPAVILFADLVGFTALSNRRAPEEVIALLNRYFDALDAPIRENGGEILKLIGDGILAIFPTPDDVTAQDAAAAGALAALETAREALRETELRFRAALHVGDIHYGNIGSATRLDFTAVGPAVNLTERMMEAATAEGAETVCSAAFAELAPRRAGTGAARSFKGFEEVATVHVLA